MTYGDRKADRVRFEHKYPVNLMGVDGTWRRRCVMLDVSATGARLEVEGSLEVLRAQEFFLLLSSTGLAFRRWRRETIAVGAPSASERALVEAALRHQDDGGDEP